MQTVIVDIFEVKDPIEVLRFLGYLWCPTFTGKPIPIPRARSFIDSFSSSFDFTGIAPPNKSMVKRFWEHSGNGATGPDGIPYECWRKTGDTGAIIIVNVTGWLAQGRLLDIGFNDGLQVFLAKKEKPSDDIEVRRSFDETRPLTLRNTGNKTVAGITAFALKFAVSRNLCPLHRGFTVNRQLGDNIIILDAIGRSFALDVLKFMPLLVLFDFISAFPSTSQTILFLVLESIMVPLGFLNICKSLYSCVRAFGSAAGVTQFLHYFSSSVLQGCPLSGRHFSLVSDSLLNVFPAQIMNTGLGLVTVCADDIGVALRSISSLPILRGLFSTIDELVCLELGLAKCIIVPLSSEVPRGKTFEIARTKDPIRNAPFAVSKHFIQLWLDHFLPAWKQFKIQSAAEYLGAFIGPTGSDSFWTSPLAKWRKRSLQIASSSSSPYVGSSLYNFRVVPVFSFLSQFRLPNVYPFEEKVVITSTLNLLFTSSTLGNLFNLHRWGGVRITLLNISTIAT